MSLKSLRKKTFLSATIQGGILWRLSLYWGIYHVVLWHVMFLYRYLQYRGELLAGGTPQTFNELYGSFALNNYSLVVCAVALWPIILWDMVRVTHRVAGPLVRFQGALRELAKGKRIDRIRLRKGDLLGEFQEVFNQFLESYNARLDTDADAKRAEPLALESVLTAADPFEAGSERVLQEVRELRQLVSPEQVGSLT
jgi:hypothetical protein